MKQIFALMALLMLLVTAVQAQDDVMPLPDSLLTLLQENNKTDMNRVNALAEVTDYYFRQRHYDEAMPYVNELKELAGILENNYVEVLGEYYSGTIMLSRNQFRNAFPVLLSAENKASIFRRTPENTRLRIRIYVSLGVCYFKCQMLSDAYESYQKGIELNDELKDPYLDYMLHTNISSVYQSMDNSREALAINKSLVAEPFMTMPMKRVPYLNIANSYITLHRYDTAAVYLDSAYLSANSPSDMIWVMMYQAQIYRFKEDYRKAAKKYQACLRLLEQNPNAEIETVALLNTGKCYFNEHQYDTALMYANLCIEKSKKNQYLQSEAAGYFLKSEILNQKRQFPGAYKSLLFHNDLKDSVDKLLNVNHIYQLDMQKELKEVEEKARMEQFITESQYHRQRLILFLILLFLIAAIIIVLLLLNRKNILLKNKKMQEESLSKELDLRNREMTAKVLSQVHRKELVSDIIEKLTDIETNKKASKNIRGIINELKQSLQDYSPEDFDYYFVQTHPDFYDNLRADFPNLTPYERRLCAYLKLNLSTKDIAAISNISPDSARTARSRLRKTLNIKNPDENLVNFFAKY